MCAGQFRKGDLTPEITEQRGRRARLPAHLPRAAEKGRQGTRRPKLSQLQGVALGPTHPRAQERPAQCLYPLPNPTAASPDPQHNGVGEGGSGKASRQAPSPAALRSPWLCANGHSLPVGGDSLLVGTVIVPEVETVTLGHGGSKRAKRPRARDQLKWRQEGRSASSREERLAQRRKGKRCGPTQLLSVQETVPCALLFRQADSFFFQFLFLKTVSFVCFVLNPRPKRS